jgi:hypothetical protein
MVAYHAISYSAFRPVAFRYLAFLPPSFILITGFLVGQVYATRYDLRTWKPYLRLAVRGGKLLLLFVLLNAVHCVALERSLADGLGEFADRSSVIFISGNGREGIFEVLLPIAYFLLLAPGLLWLRARASAAVALGALLLVGGCVTLEMSGHSSKNLFLLSAGFIGLALGLLPMQWVDRVARMWFPAFLLYALYRFCIYRFGEAYAVQMCGAAVSVFLLYSCALQLRTDSWLGRQVVMFGKYSLLGYLAQIALLQVVVRMAGGKPSHLPGVMLVALVTAGLLFLVIRSANSLRQKSFPVDVVYRAVFA